ncbi:SPFH domain / Band 7 family [Ceratobasidium sp. AG-Ba]|nr:SPFH domain / Band 7 family [Ceratobasidium sp. AG-Ba]QRW02334.1 SPFH domain / Band 7 family [Ceratobasidium sp. AG-Ba]
MQTSYAQDLGLDGVEHGFYGTMINALGACIGLFGAVPCCPCPNPFQEVHQGSVGLVTRFGQFYKAVDPGLVQVNVCSEELRRVDIKIQIAPIGRQTVITRDNVNVEIESVIYYQITNPYRAAFGIADLRQAVIERAQTTLRQVVGARVVQSVVTERDAIALEIEEIVSDVAGKWGVAIEGILIKDITFPPDVAASLSSAAQAKRVGESKAADILASPAAMQIRQLEALQSMAKSAQSKVVFVPMNLQGDVSAQLSMTNDRGEGTSAGGGSTMGGAAQRAGLLTSMADL